MNIRYLRRLDRCLGPLLMMLLAPLARLADALLWPHSGPQTCLGPETRTCVFLKLKGGGSLIIALPALLAMRRAAPQAQFILVCTQDVRIYAQLTGIFDNYSIIDDANAISLAGSGLAALKASLRADLCVDLEPNSILSSLFASLTLARRRLGLVKPDERYRALAYTDALALNMFRPIYVFYDQLARRLGLNIAEIDDCRLQVKARIPAATRLQPATIPTLGIAPFASELSRERMMPADVWLKLLREKCGDKPMRLVVFGAAKNTAAGHDFSTKLRSALPQAEVLDLCGRCTMEQSVAEIMACGEFWTIDSGLLHVARLLGVACTSFWGPTVPENLLRPIPGLTETIRYQKFACSPCVHVTRAPPCGGQNLCMISMAEPNPDRAPLWPA